MKNMLILSFITASSLSWSSAWAAGKTWKVSGSEVTFRAVGKPGFLRINGKKGAVTGQSKWDNGKLEGEYTVALKDFDTGLELRDDHMKEKYLEVKTYPDAKLTLSPLAWDAGSESKVPFKGKLKLHGHEHEVEGEATLQPDGKKLKVSAKFELKLSDYKIDIPNWNGITVAEKVDVTVDFQGE